MITLHHLKILFAIGIILFGAVNHAAAQNIDNKTQFCLGCHGPTGLSINPLQPNLDGQNESYLTGQLIAFNDESRQHTKSDSLALQLTNEEILDLASFFAKRKPEKNSNTPTLIGTSKYNTCIGCHGVNGQGLGNYPRIAGMPFAYLKKQLKDYQENNRSNQTMQVISQTLSDQDIDKLATYISSL